MALLSDWYCSYPNFALQTKQGLSGCSGCQQPARFLHLSILPSFKPPMTKAALQTSKLGRCSRTRNVEKKLQLRMLQLRPSPHVTGPPKEPGGLTSVVVADVPEPVLRSGLISQTPLLSIRSELVWREMSLCCELQMLSGSVCRSGIE